MIRMVVSILMLCLLVFLAHWLRDPLVELRTMTALAVGFLMLGAWLVGNVFAAVRLPRVSGYLVFGMVVGPSLWAILQTSNLIPEQAAWTTALPLISDGQVEQMRFIKYLAISLIAITAGGEIRIDWLRGQLGRITLLTMANVFGVGLLVFVLAWVLQPVMGIIVTPDPLTTLELVVVLAFLGLIASGNSPSIAIALINECQADGPLSRTTLAVTVCKDLVIIMFFVAMGSIGKGLLDEDAAISGTFLLALGVQLGGSILLGGLLGLVMAWFVDRMRGHLVFFIVVACFLFALLGEQKFNLPGIEQKVYFKPLLMALAAGLTMQNFRPNASAPLFHTIEEMSLPIYCLFFAVAGAELDLSVFTTLSSAAVIAAIVAIRMVGVWAIVTATGKYLQLETTWRNKLWLALTPQSGVTLALATLLLASFSDAAWARPLYNLLLGLVAVHAMVGPILYRYALISSGEAGQGAGKTPGH